MTDTPFVIVNPTSGSGRTGRTLDALTRTMRDVLGDIDLHITRGPRHATELAESAARDDRKLVIAVGGDGSIHEAVNGLMQARKAGHSRTRLGIVGQGTGGDFRRTLGIDHRLDRYLAVIASGKTRSVDVGAFSAQRLDGEPIEGYFVNILSVGIGGLVDTYVHKAGSVLGGQAAYFVASARGLLESKIAELSVRLDDEPATEPRRIRTRQIAICNGRYFGSGMHVAPMADPADGWFEIIDLGAMSKLRFMGLSSAIYQGTHLSHAGVQHLRCRSLEMTLHNEEVRSKFLLDVDGEPLGALPLRLHLIPSAIEVCVA